ncbi:MAG TPA: hypothetical protein VJH67_00880 [Candidatus Paceibacterota bacterium]
MTPEQIVASQLSSWGDKKEVYLVTEDEFKILRTHAESSVEKDLESNGDGTYLSSLLFRNYRFSCVTK